MRVVGLNRVRLDEYPVDGLREALVNAVAHRQYEDAGRNILLEVFADRVVRGERPRGAIHPASRLPIDRYTTEVKGKSTDVEIGRMNNRPTIDRDSAGIDR